MTTAQDKPPETKRVRALDVVPYHWGLWCAIVDGDPFVNEIVDVHWNEDGKLSFMLDSHNFWTVDSTVELELVALDTRRIPESVLTQAREQHAQVVAQAESQPALVALYKERARIEAEIQKRLRGKR